MNLLKIVKFDFMNILRNPMLVIVNTIFPLLMIFIMGFVTRNGYNASSISSYDYYGVSIMIFTSLMICMSATNAFMEEKVKRGNTRIAFTPVSKTQIYLSKIIATYFLGTISYTLILLAGQFIFNIRFGGNNLIYIILLINMVSLFGSCLGVMFCSIFKQEEMANSIMQIPIMIFVFFGGTFFQTASLGKIIEKVSYLSPVKWVTECAFQVIYDNNFTLYLPTLAILVVAAIICIIICQITFKIV